MRSTEEIAAEIVREIRKENVPVDEARIHNMVDAHGNSGQDQKLAAEVAAIFMAEHGLPATYSSENSVYCKVARLCFEAITGHSSENGEDIRRACTVIAQQHPEEATLSANYHILASMAKVAKELRKSGDIGTEKASEE